MKAEKYIQNAESPQEHLNNVLFQAANVEGWLDRGDVDLAHIKAVCLFRSAELLVAKLEADLRKKAEVAK